MNIIQRVIGVLGVSALVFVVFIRPPLRLGGTDAYSGCLLPSGKTSPGCLEAATLDLAPLLSRGITIIVCTVGLVLLTAGKLPRQAKH
jgi:hypothetical protein